jgi:hypothetical protein
MRRLTFASAALALVAASCVVAPIAYQDGLPAATPAPGFAAVRFEYNRAYWWHDGVAEKPGEYFSGGLRFGQDWRRFCFEEGFTALYPGLLLPCLQAGIGLRRPAVTVRALWTPVAMSGVSVTFDPILWWQASALVGTPRNPRGFGASFGGRTSRIGIGPLGVLDYSHSGISFRLEGSLTFPTPWADENVRGRVLTLGLSAEPSKPLPVR